METKFKDVAHLYLGCRFYEDYSEKIRNNTRITKSSQSESPVIGSNGWEFKVQEVKPILYPLSAMTVEQENEMLIKSGKINNGWRHDIKVNAIRTAYLLPPDFAGTVSLYCPICKSIKWVYIIFKPSY